MDPSSSRFPIATTEDDELDPLAPYERYVNWLIEREPHSADPLNSKILEVLEEAVRKLGEDTGYKKDLRYLKLWILYAKRVEKPDVIYAHLIKNSIGTIYSQLYEEYALYLEYRGRLQEATEAYRLGLKHSTRAIERLSKRYSEFEKRVASSTTLKDKTEFSAIAAGGQGSSTGTKLYHNPLRYITKKSSVQPSKKNNDIAPADGDPYEFVKTGIPVPAGRKPEKYRFNMSLLFVDGKEYCIQEARARSLGLLGKKWTTPEPCANEGSFTTLREDHCSLDAADTAENLIQEEPYSSSKDMSSSHSTTSNEKVQVLNDVFDLEPSMTMDMNAFKDVYHPEPTVTLNTKEALKAVFGMYNSPDKTMKFTDKALGSKHAPVKKVDPITLAPNHGALRKITEISNENAQVTSKSSSFRPFVDDENKKENKTPLPAKFVPFVDENSNSKTPRTTPGQRKGLALKEVFTPSTSTKPGVGVDSSSQARAETEKTFSQPTPKTVFSKVFTPVSQKEVLKSEQNGKRVLAERDIGVQQQRGGLGGLNVFSRPPDSAKADLGETGTSNVFGIAPSRSTELNDTGSKSEKGVQRPAVFRRKSSIAQRTPFAPISRDRQSHASSQQQLLKEEPADIQDDAGNEESYEEDVDEYVEDVGLEFQCGEAEENYEEVQYRAPLGGRFGQFDIMTPIAERTFEFTTSSKFTNTPTRGEIDLDKGILYEDKQAADAAQRLADELKEDEVQGEVQDEEVNESSDSSELSEPDENNLVEKTGTLSLADAIVLASSFKPLNPCNPADPQIVNTLLSLMPPDIDFHDLRPQISGLFDKLQKFAGGTSRHTGGRSSSKSLSSDEACTIQLGSKKLKVTKKLGEGGFGAVFEAKDATSNEDDFETDSDEDEDVDDLPSFALKVVKPRNIWEFHVLRRIHSTLSPEQRRSIITPHALYAYRDESVLVLDLQKQGTLLDVVNSAVQAGISQQGACLDELLVMFFAIELFKFLEGMHSAGFIHGDFKIDNCLLRLEDVPGGTGAWSGMYQPSGEGGWMYKGVKMIDFGRTIDMRMFPSGQQFIADWKTDFCDCLEMREDKPWTYQVDYFGLAGIVYCMLFGKYFDSSSIISVPSSTPVRYKLATQFKRYWQGDIWTRLFDTLLNPGLVRPNGSLPIVPELESLRMDMEKWLSDNCSRRSNSLKGLLKKVELTAF